MSCTAASMPSGHRVLTREGRWLAAVLACGPGAVLSHRSAAALWGLLATGAARIDVTAPPRPSRRPGDPPPPFAFASMPATPPAIDGVPVTTLARTLLDLAAAVPTDHLERALAQSERLRIYDHRAVEDVLARANGHRGARRLAAATARPSALTRNELEARFLAAVRRAGLPEPGANVLLDVPDHGPCEVDFLFADHRLIVETDGWETHGTRSSFETDRARDAALQAAGYRVLRFTMDDDPDLAIEPPPRAAA